MSKIALEGNASGTGTFTIAAPNSNNNYTITLPTASGALVTSDQVSSSALTKTFNMKSGGSLTAGRAVSLNSSGEVGEYPTLNTLGTVRENATNTNSYTAISTDGSRAIRGVDTSSTSTSVTYTFTGTAITNSGNATVGGTTQTITAGSGTILTYRLQISSIGTNTFLAAVCYFNTNVDGYSKFVVLTVDSNGNVTKGAETSYNRIPIDGGQGSVTFRVNTISNDKFVGFMQTYSGGPKANFSGTISGTTVTVSNDGTEINDFVNDLNLITANNKIVNLSGTSYRIGTWNNGVETTVTTTTIITDLFDGASLGWGVLDSTRVVAIYKRSGTSDMVIRVYSVTSSTGVLTLLSTFALTGAVGYHYNDIVFAAKSTTEFMYYYRASNTNNAFVNSVSLDSSGNVLGTNIDLANSTFTVTPRYNTGDVFYLNYYDTRQKMVPYTVNAYSTAPFKYLGISSTTTSAATAPVIVGGIATGASGLTINSIYYVDNAYNGTLTTSSTTGIVVGKAVSATEILLGAAS